MKELLELQNQIEKKFGTQTQLILYSTNICEIYFMDLKVTWAFMFDDISELPDKIKKRLDNGL